MPYGHLLPEQRAALRPYVEGRCVHDLGAGDLGLSHALLELGASKVVAIDKEYRVSNDPRIEAIECYFHEVAEDVDVGFASWPMNFEDYGLLKLVQRTPMFIYLGKNTDGTSCGGHDLFEHLSGREVLSHVPAKTNTLIVYGPKRVERPRLKEEHASLTALERLWWYEELMAT